MRKLVINDRLTSRESNSFKNYLKDISEIPMFTVEEEYECATKVVNGDPAALEELINRNLRFVVSVAKQYTTSTSTLEDLVNEGNIGLITAASKYKPTTGFKFITFAVWWVRKYITEFLEKNGKIVRLPANKVYAVYKLNKKIDKLEQELGRTADITEIIEAFKGQVPEENLKALEMEIRGLERLNNTQFDSLDREVDSGSEGSTTLADMLSDSTSVETDYLLTDQDTKTEIFRYLKHLKPKYKRVIIAHYGLDGNSPMSLKEIATEMDITREMVRQIRVKALTHLQTMMLESSFRYDVL